MKDSRNLQCDLVNLYYFAKDESKNKEIKSFTQGHKATKNQEHDIDRYSPSDLIQFFFSLISRGNGFLLPLFRDPLEKTLIRNKHIHV